MRKLFFSLFIIAVFLQFPLYPQREDYVALGQTNAMQRVRSGESISIIVYFYDDREKNVFFQCDGYNMTWRMSYGEAKKFTAVINKALELLRKAKEHRVKLSEELAVYSQVKILFETDNAGHNGNLVMALKDADDNPFQLSFDEASIRDLQSIFADIDWTFKRL